MDTNLVVLSGRFGGDPEIKSTQGGKTIASFSLAITDGYGDKKKTIWAAVEAWEKTAEAIQKFGVKGNRVQIEGRIGVDTWDDKKTGEKRTRTKFVASRVNFIDYPEKNNDSQGDGYAGGGDDVQF